MSMPKDINRKLEVFSTDQGKDVEALSCDGCQIYVKFLPAPPKVRKSEKFLVTSLKIVPRADITEYWLTFLDRQSASISDEDIRSLIRKAHQRGLYKACKKIVSFIEYGDSNSAKESAPGPQTGSTGEHRFNFMI